MLISPLFFLFTYFLKSGFVGDKSRFQVNEVVLYRPLVAQVDQTHSYLSLSLFSRLPGVGNSFLLCNLGFCAPLVRGL